MNRQDYIVEGRTTVPGWFRESDALLFHALDVAQRRAGVAGDILEIGCYQGASAILLGYMRNAGERLLVCDLFEGDTVNSENEDERRRFYSDLSRQSFESNYLQFHHDLPEIISGPSSHLYDAGLERTFRFIHVDGSHAYEAVRSDLLLSKRLLVPGGVVVFDDIITLHTPGVTAAVWEGVTGEGLVPLFQSMKFYGTWDAPFDIDLPSGLLSYPHEVAGHTMLHIEAAAAASAVPTVEATPAPEDDRTLRLSERERSLVLFKRRLMGALRGTRPR